MKLAAARKRTAALPESEAATHLVSKPAHIVPNATHLVRWQDNPDPVFLVHMVKAAGITRKQLYLGMKVSKTQSDMWLSGQRHDPIWRARKLCDLFREMKRSDLIVHVLAYVAGSDFGGAVLSEEDTEALRRLAKAVTK